MYVLKGYWDNEPAYYVSINNKIHNSFNFVHLTTDVNRATKFDTIEEAEKKFQFISPEVFRIYPVCPICKNDYHEHPAISRRDNKTKICSICGLQEALNEFVENTKLKATN